MNAYLMRRGIQRCHTQIIEAGGHWHWLGRMTAGVPVVGVHNMLVPVRRLMWAEKHDALPQHRVYRTCELPNCVHPDHMRPPVGERHRTYKSHAERRKVRNAVKSLKGKVLQKILAHQYGLSQQQISRLQRS